MYNKSLDNILIDMKHDDKGNDYRNNINNNKNDNGKMSLASDNRGIGVVEIVLILVVLVALVIIFKDKIIEIINKAFDSITSGTDSL